MTFQKKQIEKEADEQKQKLLRSEQSLQAAQNKEQDLRKKLEVKTGELQLNFLFILFLFLIGTGDPSCQTTHQCNFFFISVSVFVLHSHHFLVPGFFLLTGAAEGEE